jgi:hypothetical protein
VICFRKNRSFADSGRTAPPVPFALSGRDMAFLFRAALPYRKKDADRRVPHSISMPQHSRGAMDASFPGESPAPAPGSLKVFGFARCLYTFVHYMRIVFPNANNVNVNPNGCRASMWGNKNMASIVGAVAPCSPLLKYIIALWSQSVDCKINT